MGNKDKMFKKSNNFTRDFPATIDTTKSQHVMELQTGTSIVIKF